MFSHTTRQFIIKKIILIAIVVAAIFTFLTPTIVASAQAANAVNSDIPSVCATFGQNCGNVGSGASENTVVNIIASVTNWLVIVGVVIGIFFIVYGAFRMITSVGDGSKFKAGLDTVVNAILGIILLLLAYTVVSFTVGFVSGIR